jgi:hypothetical protein
MRTLKLTKHLTDFAVLIITGLTALSASFSYQPFSKVADSPFPLYSKTHATSRRPRERTSQAQLNKDYGNLPLSFEANHGQADGKVKFLSRGNGYDVLLTSTEAILTLRKADQRMFGRTLRNRPSAVRMKRSNSDTTVRMKLIGADPHSQIMGQQELPGKANYYLGKDPTKWKTNISTYARIKYSNVYPGVDLIYYGNQHELEYDFVIAPGADPTAIALDFAGANKLEVSANGDLIAHTRSGQILHRKPAIYQETNGVRQEVSGRYVLRGRHRIGFQVSHYDVTKPLVIDPVVVYSTYLGTNLDDFILGVTVDPLGSALVVGFTASLNFPNGFDVFIAKLNPSGSAFLYVNYVGGSHQDEGQGIALDASGNAYITGQTRSTDFPVTSGALQSVLKGSFDAFVTKFNSSGGLQYSTYLGGTSSDQGWGIAADPSGNAYVTGTPSQGFPLLSNPSGVSSVFVAKVNTTGSALIYATLIPGAIFGSDIGIDASGNAYVTGHTNVDFLATVNAAQPTRGGDFDAFITKLDPTGSSILYSTYFGGSSFDTGEGIAVSASGDAYITGTTSSNNFPTANPIQPTRGGPGVSDAFVTKFNPSGSVVYSTYLGGSNSERGSGIAVDTEGNAYATGGNGDAYVTKINAAGSAFVYSTSLGGNNEDHGFDVAVDSSGNAYVAGYTKSTNFPTVNPAQPASGGGAFEGFIAKISDVPPNQSPLAMCEDVTKAADSNNQATVTPEEIDDGSSDPDNDPLTLTLNPAGPFPLGTTAVILTVDDNHQASDTCTATVTVVDQTPPIITCPANLSIEGNVFNECSSNVTLTAATATDNVPGVTVTGERSDNLALHDRFQPGTTAIVWTASDTAGNTSSCSQTITVTNRNPEVAIASPLSGGIFAVGIAVTFTGNFTDNSGGMHTATWTFDNITRTGSVDETIGITTVTQSFTSAGVYLVTLSINDSCGGIGTANTVNGLTAMVVVYDPNGGFVTGGGWIDSPYGAYTLNSSLVGKASFGFVSKYLPGASLPTGNAEFQFRIANFNLKSTSYDWLVVGGAKAQIKGAGTVNGLGNYGFILTAIDGDISGGGGTDKFRIKVWDKNNSDMVIYDNKVGSSDNSNDATQLGAGSIVIHRE